MPMNPSIIIADDHPLFREAVIVTLRRLHPELAIFETESLKGLLDHVKENRLLRLVLLDLHLTDAKGIEGLVQLKSKYPNLPVVIMSAANDPAVIRKAMNSGASGFIPKTESMSTISKALSSVLEGKKWTPACMDAPDSLNETEISPDFSELTPTQLKVLLHLKNGENNKTIANALFITEATVKAHITAIFRKLNVRNRTQAVIAARYLDVPDSESIQG